jgi:hypothetical protein
MGNRCCRTTELEWDPSAIGVDFVAYAVDNSVQLEWLEEQCAKSNILAPPISPPHKNQDQSVSWALTSMVQSLDRKMTEIGLIFCNKEPLNIIITTVKVPAGTTDIGPVVQATACDESAQINININFDHIRGAREQINSVLNRFNQSLIPGKWVGYHPCYMISSVTCCIHEYFPSIVEFSCEPSREVPTKFQFQFEYQYQASYGRAINMTLILTTPNHGYLQGGYMLLPGTILSPELVK